MSEPVLYVFAISHYCEKARWALDHFGLPYRLKFTMPGMNRPIARKLGTKAGSLPFLQAGTGVVAGSSAIIDWGETHRVASTPSLAGNDQALTRLLEQRLDDVAGVHVRRAYYSAALLTDPASVRPMFSRDLPLFQRWMVTLGWPKFVPIMIKGMDLGDSQGKESLTLLRGELDWLDGMLADGRRYLAGDQFTRADITAASLLAPLVNPRQHPTYANLPLPSRLAEAIKTWQDRPILRWVTTLYAQHRVR
jgi:glutathione S-transferase